jgi:hypothetical protein
MKIDIVKLQTIYENMENVETIEYPLIKLSNGIYKKLPFDWRNFEVGKYYSDDDVQRYVINLHEDFEDFHRIDGVYKLIHINPIEIDSSEWDIDDDKVNEYAAISTQFPPIVIDQNGSIVDGGHRLEAAKQRGDDYIAVFIPVETN